MSLFPGRLVPTHVGHQVQGSKAALRVAALEGEAVLLHEPLDRVVCDVGGVEPATILRKQLGHNNCDHYGDEGDYDHNRHTAQQ